MSGVNTNTRDVSYILFSREYVRCRQTHYTLLALRKFLTEVVTISGLNLILKSNVIPELIISLILYISLLVNL